MEIFVEDDPMTSNLIEGRVEAKVEFSSLLWATALLYLGVSAGEGKVARAIDR